MVMTAGTDFQRQSYKIANSLPFDWIRRKVFTRHSSRVWRLTSTLLLQ